MILIIILKLLPSIELLSYFKHGTPIIMKFGLKLFKYSDLHIYLALLHIVVLFYIQLLHFDEYPLMLILVLVALCYMYYMYYIYYIYYIITKLL